MNIKEKRLSRVRSENIQIIKHEPNSPSELIGRLIAYWTAQNGGILPRDRFLKLLAAVIKNPKQNTEPVCSILKLLQAQLTESEWNDLPVIIANRQLGSIVEFATDHLRQKVLEKEIQEAELKIKEEENLEKLRQEKHSSALNNLRIQFQSNFLNAKKFYNENLSQIITEKEYQGEKITFVKDWIIANIFNGNQSKPLPDRDQLAAIAEVNGHVQVVARAGSGKTATLVYRAYFMLKHCCINSSEILILAFNRKAAREIRKRLLVLIDWTTEAEIASELERRHKTAGRRSQFKLGEFEAAAVETVAKQRNINLPHTMTFHALAYAIVHPEESLLYDSTDENESQALSREFQEVIDECLKNNNFYNRVRKVMLSLFREDWERIVAGGYDKDKPELLKFRRSLPRESLGGIYVKSYGEKLIADFLYEHDIPHEYEYNHYWGKNNYRPDFTVFTSKKSGLIIEYFGLKGDPYYDRQILEKRYCWTDKKDWLLLEFFPEDISGNSRGDFLENLKNRLRQLGFACNKLSEEEIWLRVKYRAIDRFTKAVGGFVGKCRKQGRLPQDLLKKIENHNSTCPEERLFIHLAYELYHLYLQRLTATGKEDFDGLLMRSAQLVEQGTSGFSRQAGSGELFKMKHIFIDEFQDFSPLFHRLIRAIQKHNPAVDLFCVGDDWQAINGFAGSDLRFFNDFEKYIGKAQRLEMSTNYRSSKKIVLTTNTLMAGFGKFADVAKKISGQVLLADMSTFGPSVLERDRHKRDILTPILLRLIDSVLLADSSVVLLSRTNIVRCSAMSENQKLDGYLRHLRSFIPAEMWNRVSISTAHGYKGMEKSTVIVLDAIKRSYPLIHPTWFLSRILGDTLEKIIQEERRLFYVALSRAVDTLIILTDGNEKSPFMEEIEPDNSRFLERLDWNKYPPAKGISVSLIVNITGRTYDIKDALKASGYKYDVLPRPSWGKTFIAKGFSLSRLQSELWNHQADGLDVNISNELDEVLLQAKISNGYWTILVNKLAD